MSALETDLLIVGAGFAGMYQLHLARKAGLSARVIERGSDVGGTWYWNRYPGARCDVQSIEYSYQFDDDLQQEWEWTQRYSPQPEILAYASHVADRFDLRRDIHFDTTVTGASFEGEQWHVVTDTGDSFTSQFLVMATGCLSSTNVPDFAGLESFAGEVYHTGNWPHDDIDFSGQRVGVIGTGSSAIQAIPLLAEQAESLTVFQRTANFTVPAHNGPLDPERVADIKSRYAAFRQANEEMSSAFGSEIPGTGRAMNEVPEAERLALLEEAWAHGGFAFLRTFTDIALDPAANDLVADFARAKIAELVTDPDTAALLSPQQTIGCKRICVDTNYFETYNRDNVTLVDVSEHPIDQITPNGVMTAGIEYRFDVLVLATGFDAMTGSLLGANISGRDGLALADAWAAGPTNYLGLTVPGFPNMFMVTGPGSPSVLTNMLVSIQHHVELITSMIEHLRATGTRSIEAQPEAAAAWVGHVNAIADLTLFTSCNSWYLGANVPGKVRVFMPLIGYPDYVKRCETVVANGYEGFDLVATS